MNEEVFGAIIVIILSFTFIFFRQKANKYFSVRDKKVKSFLLNPVTSSLTTFYLLSVMHKTNLLSYFFSIDILALIPLMILAVPFYSFMNFFYVKILKKRLKMKGFEEAAFFGAKFIFILDLLFTIYFGLNLIIDLVF
jgi:hypothetical protein